MDAADTPRLRAAVRTAGEWHWAWGLYVGGVGIATITAVLMPNNRGGNPSIVAAAMAAIVVCVLTVGRPVLRSDKSTWQSWVLVGVVVALSLLAISCSPVVDAPVPVAMAAVPAIYPVIYTSLPMWAAPVVTIAVTVTPLIMVLTAGRPISTDIPLVFGVTLIGVIAAPVIGTLGALATRQRTKLAAVVKELAASRAESARLSSEAGAAAERERLAREIHDTLTGKYPR